jgi:hypothetical protein
MGSEAQMRNAENTDPTRRITNQLNSSYFLRFDAYHSIL